MELAREIERLIAPAIEGLGFELVRVSWQPGSKCRLQVMAERPDGSMTADDCAELSRSISAILDVENPITVGYVLEVSSPGIDRPLVKIDDFERFSGFEARLEMNGLIDGRRQFRGKLLGVKNGHVNIQVENDAVSLPFDRIAGAKLVLTDELLKVGGGKGS